MSLNDKKPPEHCFEFAYKRDLEFKHMLPMPVDGSEGELQFTECVVKVTYPVLKSREIFCLVKSLNEGDDVTDVAVVCRGLLPLHCMVCV